MAHRRERQQLLVQPQRLLRRDRAARRLPADVRPGTRSGAPIGGAGGEAWAWSNSDLAFDESHTGWLMVEAGSQTGSTGNTEIVAMDPTNGSLHWDTKLPSGPTPGSFNLLTEAGIFSSDVGNSAPAIGTDGTVYLGNVDGLYALNGATGAINWTYKPSQDTGANADVVAEDDQ